MEKKRLVKNDHGSHPIDTNYLLKNLISNRKGAIYNKIFNSNFERVHLKYCPIWSGARMEIQTLKETIMGDFIVTTTNATMLPHMGKNIYSVL